MVDVTINDFRFLNDFRLDGPGNTGDPCGFPPGTTVGCSPPGVLERVERDRDGEGYGAAIEHRYLVPVDPRFDDYIESFVLRGSYRISWYDSQGTEWEGLSNIFSLGFNVQLPYGFSFDAQGTYERYDYDNPSTFPDFEIANVQYGLDSSDREEDAAFVETELEKDLNEFLSVTARYSYYSISSNVRVYQYRRHIGGLYLNYRFD